MARLVRRSIRNPFLHPLILCTSILFSKPSAYIHTHYVHTWPVCESNQAVDWKKRTCKLTAESLALFTPKKDKDGEPSQIVYLEGATAEPELGEVCWSMSWAAGLNVWSRWHILSMLLVTSVAATTVILPVPWRW